MNGKERSLASIKREIRAKKTFSDQIQAARVAVRNTALPLAQRGAEAAPLWTMLAATPAKQTFRLLAQGDSWFDYPPGTDLIDCVHRNHGHEIVNIARNDLPDIRRLNSSDVNIRGAIHPANRELA